jgi:ribosome maturation factor RimP
MNLFCQNIIWSVFPIYLTFAGVKDLVKGTEAFPSSIFQKSATTMITELEKIEDFVKQFIRKTPDLFLIEVKSAPGNKITVLLDGDKGVTIENCTAVNKALYKFIEETGLFGDNNFALEVSSFGVDKPLKLFRQYNKNIGRKVEVILNEGTKIEGTLTDANEENITIEEKTGKGNKMTTKKTTILFNQIKHTTVLITF